MKRLIILAGAALSACTTPASTPSPEPRPGLPRMVETLNDCDDLVPIDAVDTSEGLAMEHAWLEQHYPGAEVTNQSMAECGDTPADRVTFIQGGVERIVLFDASAFFGVVEGDDLDALLDG